VSRRSTLPADIAAFVVGLLFAGGLVLGGMTQPSKVIAFLDVAGGAWDPSLAFVMGGAILVHAPVYALVVRRRSQPVLQSRFHVPQRRDITVPLLAGSGLFGIGWGLGGYCPGPALVSMPTLGLEALTFVGAMTVGMLLHHLIGRTKPSKTETQAPRASRADA
jgi:uncharacterized membrane protein YedE/YeeE